MDMFEIDDKNKFESLNVLLQSQQLFDGAKDVKIYLPMK